MVIIKTLYSDGEPIDASLLIPAEVILVDSAGIGLQSDFGLAGKWQIGPD